LIVFTTALIFSGSTVIRIIEFYGQKPSGGCGGGLMSEISLLTAESPDIAGLISCYSCKALKKG